MQEQFTGRGQRDAALLRQGLAVSTTHDEHLCHIVGEYCELEGIAFRRGVVQIAGKRRHRVTAACAPSELRRIARTARAILHAAKVWPEDGDAPKRLLDWAEQLATYINSIAPTLRPDLVPELAALIAEARVIDDRPLLVHFDLSEPVCYGLFLDYLGEYPERLAAWRAFEAQHGKCRRLCHASLLRR